MTEICAWHLISLIYAPGKSGLRFDFFSLLEEQSVTGLSTSFTLVLLVEAQLKHHDFSPAAFPLKQAAGLTKKKK